MTYITYVPKNFSRGSLDVIERAQTIIQEYADQGFTMTLRQLYYQFVARGLLANKQSEYKRLGSIVNDARLAGMIDWHAMEDRTRYVRSNAHWDSPADVLRAARDGYATDKWHNQPIRPEVWIEKEALVGVIAEICEDLDVAYFCCRGYASQSLMWRAGRRFKAARMRGQTTVVLHLGDHDPSGIDMTWDNWKRLALFASRLQQDEIEEAYDAGEAFRTQIFSFGEWSGAPEVRRLALNYDQVEQYSPPPNPAKFTDSRVGNYLDSFGRESWELDALEPMVLARLIRGAVLEYRDEDLWRDAETREDADRNQLTEIIASLDEEP